MYLTKEEERILNGEKGYASQVAMRILVTLGDLYEADRLIPIEWAHVAGVSYKNLGDASIEFLERLWEEGAETRVPSTLNPCALDLEKWTRMPVSRKRYEAQLRIIRLYSEMGMDLTLTCTPYYLRKVRGGAHLAWSESSAVSYANSVLGARTNREGGPSALAAALIGKTPRYGLHLDEHRKGDLLVNVHAPLKSASDYGALGNLVGREAGMRVPVFKGIRRCDESSLKALGASMAAGGAVSLYHVMGVTPEWPLGGKTNDLWRGGKPEDVITIDRNRLNEAYSGLTTSRVDSPDLAFIGCPHCSISEMERVARLMAGRRVRRGARFWLCTSRWVKAVANGKGLITRLEASGVEVYCDTCIVVTWIRDANIDSVITNSAKAAYYIPQLCGVDVIFTNLEEMVKKVTERR